MDLFLAVATTPAKYLVSPAKYGTAQVLTFALPIGTLAGVCLWGFFQRWPRGTQREEERLFKLEDLQLEHLQHEDLHRPE